ncbi:hypothetical protein LCGC14_0386810 [marine sediment metagenome]|uniref:HK97 gp10 family phage protein n=1 Tax=marine sediment metagenome TaxID=412755 RepID=A0A0F9W9M9_9ZZZZ
MSIQIQGLDKLYKKLGKAAAIEVLVRPMHESVQYVETTMKQYPPKIPGSRYIRGYGYKGGSATSEQLGKNWSKEVKRKGGGVVGTVGNPVSYGPLVQSERFQAKVHQGRWQTDKQVVEGNYMRRLINRAFKRAVDKALKG